MARGWESKSVESQIDDSREGSANAAGLKTAEQKTVQRERDGLLLSRSYVQRQLELSSNQNHQQSLRQALADIDDRLAKLGLEP